MLLESSACLSLKTDKTGHSKVGKYPALSAASLSKGEIWVASKSQQAAAQSVTIPTCSFSTEEVNARSDIGQSWFSQPPLELASQEDL